MFSTINDLNDLCEDLRLSSAAVKEQRDTLADTLAYVVEVVETEVARKTEGVIEAIQHAKEVLSFTQRG